MSSTNIDPENPSQLVARIDEVLDSLDVSNDFHTVPTIAIAFCDVIHESLTTSQKCALAAARRYLSAGDGDEADKWILDLAKRVGKRYPAGTDPVDIERERLVWGTLNRNTVLSGVAIEFLLLTGQGAGLSFEQMCHAVKSAMSGVLPSV
ncbi:hypothetical protein KR767_10050 [Luteibacter anthropi]|uniref:hypothetical protein n=1 Tax=Luteibacter anthropi TaxID=564369 RepID=UPI002032E3A9|nr:hypothetical protein [Luteibacter anthropi]URX64357.1 hypothetical protein KR767_10050 [Luteibacter anthropi]